MSNINIIKEYVEFVLLEKQMREAEITGGKKVAYGDNKHIKDLETRINDLSTWRDKCKRGSDARANYSRLINKLKSELSSARKHALK